jgi:hypothetical protein
MTSEDFEKRQIKLKKLSPKRRGPDIPGKIIFHGPQSVEDAKHEAQEALAGLDGHDAFDIRLCGCCGVMSDQEHRNNCQDFPPGHDDREDLYFDDQYVVDRDKELEVHIRKISNGYVVSVNDEEQIFYAHDTVVVVLFKDLLGKLS